MTTKTKDLAVILEGLPIYRRGDTFFVPLPDRNQITIDGGCSCAWCKAHPGHVPTWDTLALAKGSRPWAVHFPELPR